MKQKTYRLKIVNTTQNRRWLQDIREMRCQEDAMIAEDAEEKIKEFQSILFDICEKQFIEHQLLIEDRLSKSILSGGSVVFIHPYTYAKIGEAKTLEDFYRLRLENGIEVTLIFVDSDGSAIPISEEITQY